MKEKYIKQSDVINLIKSEKKRIEKDLENIGKEFNNDREIKSKYNYAIDKLSGIAWKVYNIRSDKYE